MAIASKLVMCHKNGRNLKSFLKVADLLAHDEPQVRVEVGQRLIQEKHLRLEAERPGEGDTLLLTTGEFVDHPISKRVQFDHLEQFLDPRLDPVLGPLVDLQTVADVFRYGHMGKEGVILKADPRIPQIRRKIVDSLSVKDDIPGTDIGKTADEAQQRRLSTPARPDECDQFSLAHLQGNTLDDLVFSIKLVDVLQNQHRSFIFLHVHIVRASLLCHTAADFFMLPPNLVLLLMKFRISMQTMTIRTSFIVVAEAIPISP